MTRKIVCPNCGAIGRLDHEEKYYYSCRKCDQLLAHLGDGKFRDCGKKATP